MQQPIQEIIAYQLQVPDFMNTFKQKAVGLVLPHLLELKAFINSQKNAATINPLILIATIVIVLYLLKSIWTGLFGKRIEEQSSESKESPELNAEVNQLKKQLKSLKSSFNELIKQIPASKQSQSHAPSQNQPASNDHSNQLWAQVLPLYTASLQNNKKLVDYVLESQFEMLKQLKKFKKAQRSSLSSGRPSTSTIRSKTTDKKLQSSISKSPLKAAVNTMSSIKKPEIKNVEKEIKSEINQKSFKPEESFLIPAPSPKKQTSPHQVKQITVKEEPIDKKGFEKLEKPIKQVIVPSEPKKTENLFKTLSDQDSLPQKNQTKPPVLSNQNYPMMNEETFSPNNQFQQAHPLGENQEPLSSVPTSENQPTEQQLQEPQIFVPPKIPVIKKMNIPSKGSKRPPPPPPKK